MIDQTVTILENKKINARYYKLCFRSPHLARRVEPGQFVNILLQPGLDPFLRRPFSYYRVTGSRIEILYEVLGRGTALLAAKKKGDTLRVMGPLGRPFSRGVKGRRKILVAGGIGVPPLIFLAEKEKVDYFLIGCKSRNEVMPRRELAKVKGRILYATNDGSYGWKGYVTLLLEQVIRQESAGKLFLQTCGPRTMMKVVMEIARREGIPGEASVDERMACGVGACLGCVVKTEDGWVPSCTYGPVFPFEKLEVW